MKDKKNKKEKKEKDVKEENDIQQFPAHKTFRISNLKLSFITDKLYEYIESREKKTERDNKNALEEIRIMDVSVNAIESLDILLVSYL